MVEVNARASEGIVILLQAIAAVIILATAAGYVVFRKLTVTRQEIAFDLPQDGVTAIYLDIREDVVRGLHIRYEDGTICEVPRLAA
jgi:hypothetical protein